MAEEFSTYQSPFSWRYGSTEMRSIWGEQNKRLLWRTCWVALAQTQMDWGLVTPAQLADLVAHQKDVDIPQALEIEKVNRHDLMAELQVFAHQCQLGGGIIHLGATSMDIKDNAEVMQIAQALDLLIQKCSQLIETTASKMDQYAELTVMAFTHLQPAEPTTLGYRLASFGQDLLDDYSALLTQRSNLRAKGFKGAVGNAASYMMLYGGQDGFEQFEAKLSKALGMPFKVAATQTYPRKQDYFVLSAISGLAATLYKFAFDLRILQSQVIGELSEPFGEGQVGSSAMPFKRNPIDAEKIDSLARVISFAPQTAWQNSAHSLLERTLDDSANRRSLLPETFLSMDELLITTTRLMAGLQVNMTAIEQTMRKFGPFSAVERVLMALVKTGANRQDMHAVLRDHSMKAWEVINHGCENPLQELIRGDVKIVSQLGLEELEALFDVNQYTGIASARAHLVAEKMRKAIIQ